jgi:hypothetical protein
MSARSSSKDKLDAVLVQPILGHRPAIIPEKDFLTYVMCINTRPIVTYKAVKPFTMPGIYLDNGVHERELSFPVQRSVKPKDKIVVRRDEVLLRVDAEFSGRVFRLTNSELEFLRRHVDPIKNNKEVDKDVIS